ncbi:MAG: 50S ribosomal protein L13 [Lachnospiraceae bacterium]|nr:50S ribosomal protein L13 [Lachnospiraceae bacterium]
MNTFMPNEAAIERKWYVVDASGYTLGRLSSEVAKILRGKNKPVFTPHADTGDYVIIVNAAGVKVTGNKLDDKIYYHHTGHIGGLKGVTLREKMDKKPCEVLEKAIRGMLPKGPLGNRMYKKLFVYAGAEHPHAAQKPEELKF